MRIFIASLLCFGFIAQTQGQNLISRFFGSRCGSHRCHPNAVCRGNFFGYTCHCQRGYYGSGFSCLDINECRIRNMCGQGSTGCTNTPGSYQCRCQDGYELRNGRCRDINECSGNVCRRNSRCINTAGSYRCQCKSGYRQRNGRCRDINECRNRNTCGQGSTGCKNTPGSYQCRCKGGYEHRNGKCRDINECSGNVCGRNSRCINNPGSYRCQCKTGYRRRNGRCRVIPTTTSTSTPVTTRRPTNTNRCKGQKRVWTECVGTPPTRFTNDTCDQVQQVCTDGTILGGLFAKNMLAPSQESSGSSQGGLSSRTLSINGAPPPPSLGGNQTCTVVNIRNSAGEVIAGKCQRQNTRRNSRGKRQVNPQPTTRDLLIMMDESGSVGRRRYEIVKRITAAIVRLLCEQVRVHPQYTRVSIMSFNRGHTIHIRLDSGLNAEQLANYIFNNIYYRANRNTRNTCLIQALDIAYNTALSREYGGRRGNIYTEQDIIIISDGCENCIPRRLQKEAIQQQTNFFINRGVHVYVIGIGLNQACKNTLSLLAQGGRCFHFFYLTRWEYEVEDFVEQLESPPPGICLNVFESPLGQCLTQ